MQDRRVFVRMNLKIPLKFLGPRDPAEKEAETVDISATGIGFITREKLSPKEKLEMRLYIPDGHQPVYLIGEVVWSEDLPDKSQQQVGVELNKERFLDLGRVLNIKENK